MGIISLRRHRAGVYVENPIYVGWARSIPTFSREHIAASLPPTEPVIEHNSGACKLSRISELGMYRRVITDLISDIDRGRVAPDESEVGVRAEFQLASVFASEFGATLRPL